MIEVIVVRETDSSRCYREQFTRQSMKRKRWCHSSTKHRFGTKRYLIHSLQIGYALVTPLELRELVCDGHRLLQVTCRARKARVRCSSGEEMECLYFLYI
ncbi:hypothetical protein EVAR_43103_1 [Eumeta japonica]|uniref:Uncharacterized protein n=1 Tax=Eumeta variegata TaxID=151549 RepID=A0A4C1YFG1_EUMVA|nr:hypothetical protein EVAR_43103_1 [Eumeta japonica]